MEVFDVGLSAWIELDFIQAVERTIEALSGGLVVIPTDTVFGLASSVRQTSAIKGLFAIKNRPSSVTIPVLVKSVDTISNEFPGVPASQMALLRVLAKRFWPGPLTIVVTVGENTAKGLGGEGNSLGFRSPASGFVQAVLEKVTLACTSANLHGSEPGTTARAVLESFSQDRSIAELGLMGLRLIVGGEVEHKRSSTVVDIRDGRANILREGALDSSTVALFMDEASLG